LVTAPIRTYVLLSTALLFIGACAHAPTKPAVPTAPSTVVNSPLGTFPVAASARGAVSAAQPQSEPAGTNSAPSPAGAAVTVQDVSTPLTPVPTAAVTAPDAAPAAQGPTQVAGLTPAQYADLFDRMRAGFRLQDESEHAQVGAELRWYANNPDYLQRAFSRADLYLYHIVTELERRGMPLEIALLPVVESAFEPYAYSSARASGLWQFIPGTGTTYGLKQDWWYDGRRDILESTRAALDYLQTLHDEFNGDWELAIGAYNCGELTMERAVAKNRARGKPVDFWSLKLPRETMAYVPKLLAMKRLVLDPEQYGLEMSPIPNQPYFARVETHSQVSIKVAAEIAGLTPEEIYELNPAFHRWATDPVGPHYLLVPIDVADVFADNIAQLTPDQRLGATHYTVVRGDSIVTVAAQFHTTINVIRELNDMPTRGLAVDDDLRVPSAVPELPPKVMLAAARVDGRIRSPRPHVQIVRRGESLWTIAHRHGMNVNTLAMMNGLHPGDPLRAGQRIRLSAGGSAAASHGRRVTYTVRDGDTVPEIAKLFQCSVPQLLAWNGLSSHAHIHAGQKLRIQVSTHHDG
jgi:membrane-bound lytic murein transglycosylase D